MSGVATPKCQSKKESSYINKKASPIGEAIILVRRFEFFEEAGVVFGEHAEVGDAIFQIRDALDAHTEGIARRIPQYRQSLRQQFVNSIRPRKKTSSP